MNGVDIGAKTSYSYLATRLHIPIFVPNYGGQEPGAGFLFLLGFLRNPKGTFVMFLLFIWVGTLVPLRNRNMFLLP
jgi:hypothetical protein